MLPEVLQRGLTLLNAAKSASSVFSQPVRCALHTTPFVSRGTYPDGSNLDRLEGVKLDRYLATHSESPAVRQAAQKRLESGTSQAPQKWTLSKTKTETQEPPK